MSCNARITISCGKGLFASGTAQWIAGSLPLSGTLHPFLLILIVAIIAAVFGFTGIAVGVASIAKILFAVFLVLAVFTMLGGLLFGKRWFGGAW